MESVPYRFPLFIDLQGKPVTVIGGGKVAQRRVQVLTQFGARVTVIAPEILPMPESTEMLRRAYMPGDLQGAFLAVAATDSRTVNRQVGREAADRSIFVSVADSPEESSFFFPAICQGSSLVAGVVSRGAEHSKTARAARAIRTILEDLP